MRFLFASVMVLGLSGCGTMISSEHYTTKSTTNMPKKCGCAGSTDCCTRMGPNCGPCCSSEECKCDQVTSNK